MLYGKLARGAIFLAIGALMLIGVEQLLRTPRGVSWASQTGMQLVQKRKNVYDVLAVGTSTTIASISNQELYEQYGIASVTVGEPEQPVYLSRYTLKDAFLNQRPKVVLLDSKAFFYSEEVNTKKATNQADYILHNSIDPIRNLSVKKKAVEEAKIYSPNLDAKDYFFPFYYNHGNWKQINETRWRTYSNEDAMNGNVALFSMTDQVGQPYEQSPAAEEGEAEELIAPSVREHIAAIRTLCEEHGASLVLLTGYVTFTRAEHEAVHQIADQLGIPYLDINEVHEEIGLDPNTDVADGGAYAHLNLLGAIKWSDYLGSWMEDQFNLTDHRGEQTYRFLEQNRAVFAQQRAHMEQHLELERALDLQSYLQALAGLDLKKYAVFLSVYDDGTGSLSEEDFSLFHALGLTGVDELVFRENYTALLSDVGVQENHRTDESARLTGLLDGQEYIISSGGLYFSADASMRIGDTEYMQKRRGFNIVVYDRVQGEVINSVSFDTYAMENPPKQRVTISSTTVVQSAVGSNRWADALN